jgi:hypothetical protein
MPKSVRICAEVCGAAAGALDECIPGDDEGAK